MSNILVLAILERKDWSFYYNDELLGADQVANPRCMLPAILWNAERLHEAARLGGVFGVQFPADDGAFLGRTAYLEPHPNRPRGPLPLFCLETLCQVQEHYLRPNGDGAALDPLVQSFLAARDQGLLPGPDAGPRLAQGGAL